MEEDEQPRRRGRPQGSKNKPKITGIQRKTDGFSTAEDRIQGNIHGLIDVLIKSAVEDGDVMAAKYLIDRLWGRPTERRENSGVEQKVVIEMKEDWRT